MVADGRWRDAVDVPCHIEEQAHSVGSNFRVMDIQYPQAACVVVVGCLHLIAYQSWLCGGKPQVVVRTSPIAQVIVHSCASAAFLLQAVGEAGEVAVVVVAPHQRYIVGHAEPVLIYFQYFLVWHEHLRNVSRLASEVLVHELPLLVNDTLQAIELLFGCFHTLH